jgi:predicted nuclease of predicted toxin-antitoxin system
VTTRLLPDQNIPRSTADELRRRGFDVVHTGEIGMARSLDVEILDFAMRESRVVVTFDADFHQLMAARGTTRPSVLRLRTTGLPGKSVADLIEGVFSG